jgi:hypothetical protein
VDNLNVPGIKRDPAIEHSYILLSTVHVSFQSASLRMSARVRKLEGEQIRNDEPLDQARIDVEQRTLNRM